ncbi:Ribose import ATP-binding protein RbsA [Polystyrenella longa]|uniref:Ribose import ATP-binding protein RbsA n=1 Tax=Polystyrenella longa TaxID=2528007 RepID=A0A518CHN3_9PLAN|nr:sugar ABC transporter ATP-binding protein [Polystyrenella longa]QDU78735.1 Ribose import ATP-binding protein RbsA [Polystyrenella longa]
MSATPLIEISQISKNFGGVQALREVSFAVQPGEMHALVGENGAGKSTLMKILSGVQTDYDGELIIHGKTVRFLGTRDAEAAGISIIHQELNLVENLSVAANVFLGREETSGRFFLDDRSMERKAAELLQQLDCVIAPRQPVGELRVGDQQLIEIAKALSIETELIIMDEPTSALTESEVERLFRVIDQLLKQGKTIIYISHKMDEIFRRSDRITVLRDGTHVVTKPCSELSPKEVTHLMVGREIESTELGANRQPGETLLKVEGLSLPWPGHVRQWRLKDVHLELKRGEVVGIAGLMGAGRTELLESLFGATDVPPQGQVLLEGKPVNFQHPADAMQAGIALVTEDRKRLGLFSDMNIRENITLCTLPSLSKAGLISTRQERDAADESIKQLGVKTSGPEAPILSLSGGNQQKCIIARWLRTDPKLLLLDDPTRGVDVGAKAEIYQIIDELCRAGMGLLITSSELPELMIVCDRILVLCEGRLTGEFTRDQFSEGAIMEAATGAIEAAAV